MVAYCVECGRAGLCDDGAPDDLCGQCAEERDEARQAEAVDAKIDELETDAQFFDRR